MRDSFRDIKSFCMFVGSPFSGHSLLGSLLDAHPHMVIAHELGVLELVEAGFSRHQLYALLIDNSRRFAEIGRGWNGYPYRVDHQWQGRFEKLYVIGEKRGSRSTKKLESNPNLLPRLAQTVGSRVKLIHVVRNPYDNISTMHLRASQGRPVADSVDEYFSLCSTVAAIQKNVGDEDFLSLRHENIITEPKNSLMKVCHFLGLNCAEGYLNDCAKIVWEVPHKSCYDMEWNKSLIEMTKERLSRFDFLQGYSCWD